MRKLNVGNLPREAAACRVHLALAAVGRKAALVSGMSSVKVIRHEVMEGSGLAWLFLGAKHSNGVGTLDTFALS